MKEENKYAVDKLRSALTKLKEGISIATGELEQDGVIQRFEFTFELLWKAIKTVYGEEGIEIKTPKESLKIAFRMGLIDHEEVCLNMLEDRNKMSHIYEKHEAEKIFLRIKTQYIQVIEQALARLEQKITN